VRLRARDLKRVRDELIGRKLARTTINALQRRIVRLFRWAVAEEFCPAEIPEALAAVPGLRKGRSAAREAEAVASVPESDVNAVLGNVSRQIRDMVRLQLLTGCRPGEITAVRPCDVNRDGAVWEFVPRTHKTEHHHQGRRVYIGPRAQAILAPYLDDRPAESYCFSPAEAEAEAARLADRHAARVTPKSCGNRPGLRRGNPKWKPGERYTVPAYRKAIARGCEAAGVPAWNPNQLRHARATDLRRRYGVEATSTVLGHSTLDTTTIYAEQDFARARAIMSEVG
jgi:integrase